MGLTVSYRHVWRRDLSSGLSLPFPRMMARRPCHIEQDFDCFRDGSCQLRRTSRSSAVCVPPFPPWYQHMLISRQNRTGKRFIHLPSPPDIMSLVGNCNSCADLLCDISPPDIMLLAGNCIPYAGPFFNIPPRTQRQSPDPRRRTSDRGLTCEWMLRLHKLSLRPTRPAPVPSQRPRYPSRPVARTQ